MITAMMKYWAFAALATMAPSTDGTGLKNQTSRAPDQAFDDGSVLASTDKDGGTIAQNKVDDGAGHIGGQASPIAAFASTATSEKPDTASAV